jgi:hypothetical protein
MKYSKKVLGKGLFEKPIRTITIMLCFIIPLFIFPSTSDMPSLPNINTLDDDNIENENEDVEKYKLKILAHYKIISATTFIIWLFIIWFWFYYSFV